jgi:hypothetical protein
VDVAAYRSRKGSWAGEKWSTWPYHTQTTDMPPKHAPQRPTASVFVLWNPSADRPHPAIAFCFLKNEVSQVS